MGEARTIEMVARDRQSGTVILATSTETPGDTTLTLRGTVVLRPEPQYPEPIQVQLLATISDEDGDGPEIRQIEDRLVALNADGERVGLEFESYKVSRSVDEKYEIHSGVVSEEGGRADVFAISDVIHFLVPAWAVACLALYGGQLWIIKKTYDAYAREGLVPQIGWSAKTWKAVLCQFDVEIAAVDPRTGQVVRSETVQVGRRGRR